MQGFLPQQTANINNNNQMINANEISIGSVKNLRELMVRNDWFLPHLRTRYCTHKTLLAVKSGAIFGLKTHEVTTKECPKPPSKRVLVDKLEAYVR